VRGVGGALRQGANGAAPGPGAAGSPSADRRAAVAEADMASRRHGDVGDWLGVDSGVPSSAERLVRLIPLNASCACTP
jgi:hypothetical protein